MTESTARQIRVLNHILNAVDEMTHDIGFWISMVQEYGLYPFSRVKNTVNKSFYTENGMMQVPSEIASFCMLLSGMKISNALEIGVYRGRSSYFICAAIYRSNPLLIYEMVDIVDNLDEFAEFQKVLPCLRKNIPTTSDDYAGKEYDFVFIDADHSYEASMRDYCNVGRFAKKVLAFHDIFAHEYDEQSGGVCRTWREICAIIKHRPKIVFSENYEKWMSIGAVINTEEGCISSDCDYEKAKEEANTFINALKKYERIYVYGAMADSRQLFYALNKMGLDPLGYVVSTKEEAEERKIDAPVFCFEDLWAEGLFDEKTGIAVALRDEARRSVESYLEDYEGLNLILTDDVTASMI